MSAGSRALGLLRDWRRLGLEGKPRPSAEQLLDVLEDELGIPEPVRPYEARDRIDAGSLGTQDAIRRRAEAGVANSTSIRVARASGRAYEDGYKQGFYDASRGNPSRFEEL